MQPVRDIFPPNTVTQDVHMSILNWLPDISLSYIPLTNLRTADSQQHASTKTNKHSPHSYQRVLQPSPFLLQRLYTLMFEKKGGGDKQTFWAESLYCTRYQVLLVILLTF